MSLVHLLDYGPPNPPTPPALSSTLAKKWATGAGVNEDIETSGCYSHAATDLSTGDLDDIGRAH